MPDIKEPKKTDKRLTDGILSQEAVKEISRLFKSVDIEKGITEKQIKEKVHDLAAVVLADIDGADGKFDHKISKKVAIDKIGKIEALVGKNSDYGELLEGAKKMIKKESAATIDSEALLTKIDKNVADMVGKVFKKVDLDKDGKLEMNEIITKEKATLSSEEVFKAHGVPARASSRAKPHKSGINLG